MIDDIMNVMSDIEYGFKDDDGFNIINDNNKWDLNFNDFYYLQTPEELLISKCGVCWDQVELERKLFKEHHISFKTYFIFIKDDEMLPSHTFLVYKDNNKYYWFEHSWYKYRGIHEYNSIIFLLEDVINKFKLEHIEVSDKSVLYLYEYDLPKKHIKCDEFYKYIETQKLVDVNKEDF